MNSKNPKLDIEHHLKSQFNKFTKIEIKNGIGSAKEMTFEQKIQKIIQEKNKILETEKQLFSDSGTSTSLFSTKGNQIKDIAGYIKQYFSSRNISNVFEVALIDSIFQKYHFSIISKTEVSEILDYLVTNSDGWISYVPNKEGRIVRLNRKIEFKKMLENLKK